MSGWFWRAAARTTRTIRGLPEDDSWQTLIESLAMFSEDFMAERQQPPVQSRERLFE